MKEFQQPDDRNAYEAKFEAQKIAFSPFVFQAVRALLKTGILRRVAEGGKQGVSIKEIASDLDIDAYGIGVLLDLALTARLVWQRPETEAFVLDKIGYFLLGDEMTRVNFNFTADVNYLALDKLTDAILSGKPAGLREFTTEHDTIYPFISQLPEPAKTSWFEFDHYYSDGSFEIALEKVLADRPKVVVDIGGNTGKFAGECLRRDSAVKMVMVDLPGQIDVARANLAAAGLDSRVRFEGRDLLAEELPDLRDADVVWMSQFLDCFSLAQISAIMRRVRAATAPSCKVYVMELLWDRQEPEAAYCLNATSLYFTAVANGRSRMYSAKDLLGAMEAEGFTLAKQWDDIGVGGHSLLCLARGS